MLPKHVRYQAALHPARPGCRHRRWFCSRRRNISYYTCVHLSTPFFNFSEKTSLPSSFLRSTPWLPCVRGTVRRRAGLKGCPLGVRGKGKGKALLQSAHRNLLSEGSGVPHGLFSSDSALRCLPLKRSCFRFAPLTLRCRTEPALQAAPVFRMAYFPYLTAFRMQAKQIQRLPLRGAGAKRLKGGPWG